MYRYTGGCLSHTAFTQGLCLVLTVHEGDGLWEQTLLVSVHFGVQCSVAPTRAETLEQVMHRV